MDDPASYILILFADTVQQPTSFVKIIVKLLAVFLFVGAHGFFVGAEFALVSVRRPRLETRAAGRSQRAEAALRLIHDPTTSIAAAQRGLTIASLALGWLGAPA